MKAPTCKLCGDRHWLDEGHKLTAALDAVREIGASVLHGQESPRPAASSEEGSGDAEGPTGAQQAKEAPPNKRTEPITVRNKRTRGRPKKWASEADRLKAYRGRSKG